MTHLRHISVFVDEPVPGHFFWVLHEFSDGIGGWIDVLDSEEPFETWMKAFEAGCIELFKLAPDERIGPQKVSKNDDPVE